MLIAIIQHNAETLHPGSVFAFPRRISISVLSAKLII